MGGSICGIDRKITGLTDKLNLALNLQISHRAVVFPDSIHRSILAVDNLVRCVHAIRPNASCTYLAVLIYGTTFKNYKKYRGV